MFATGQVDDEHADGRKKRRRSCGSRKSQYIVKSVDEITEEDLENIAYRSKDKIWDKENVSHFTAFLFYLRLFRDMSRATELVCVLTPSLGQLLSPVQAEDAGHQDGVSQWSLCGGQRSVLWTVPEESLWRGRAYCAAGPGQCLLTHGRCLSPSLCSQRKSV